MFYAIKNCKSLEAQSFCINISNPYKLKKVRSVASSNPFIILETGVNLLIVAFRARVPANVYESKPSLACIKLKD